MKSRIIGCILGLFVSSAASAVELTDSHPSQYTVKSGDTLWDISSKFLDAPWQWPEIWLANKQVKNPHLIYPGDVLKLVYIDGKPYIQVERVTVLAPGMKVLERDDAILTIPLEAIEPFLNSNQVLADQKAYLSAPYVLQGAEEHLVVGVGQQLFAKTESTPWPTDKHFHVVKEGQDWVDPITQEYLGFEVIETGSIDAIELNDDIGRFLVTDSVREILPGNRLVPVIPALYDLTFMPKAPEQSISGLILDVAGGVSQVGRMSVVMINKGEREALQRGDVLDVWKRGEVVRDPVKDETVKLPDQLAGQLMVFNVFDKVSYGIVLKANRPLTVGDFVKSPQ